MQLPSCTGSFGYGDLFISLITQVHAASDALYRLGVGVYAEYPYHCYAYVTFTLRYILPWLAAQLVFVGRCVMGLDMLQSICGTTLLCVLGMLCVRGRALLEWLALAARHAALCYLDQCACPTRNVLDNSDPSLADKATDEWKDGLPDIRRPTQTGDLLQEFGLSIANCTDPGHISKEADHISVEDAGNGDLIIFGADAPPTVISLAPNDAKHEAMAPTTAAECSDSPSKDAPSFVRSRAVSSSLAHLDVGKSVGKGVPEKSQTLPVAKIYPMKDVVNHRGSAVKQRTSYLPVDKGMSGDRCNWVTFDTAPMDSKTPSAVERPDSPEQDCGVSTASLHLPAAMSSITYVRYTAPSPGSSTASLASIPRLRLACEPTGEFSYARLDSSADEVDACDHQDVECSFTDLLLNSALAHRSSRVVVSDHDGARTASPDDPGESVFRTCSEALQECRLQSQDTPSGSSAALGHVIREKSWLGMFGVRDGLQWRPCNALLYADYLEIHILGKEGRLKRLLHYPTATLRLQASLSLKCGARARRPGRRLTLRALGQPTLLLRALSHAHKTDLKNSLEYVMRSAQQAKCP